MIFGVISGFRVNDVNMVCNLNIDTGDFSFFYRIISLMVLLWTAGDRDRIIMQKDGAGRRSSSKNRKYRQSITGI